MGNRKSKGGSFTRTKIEEWMYIDATTGDYLKLKFKRFNMDNWQIYKAILRQVKEARIAEYEEVLHLKNTICWISVLLQTKQRIMRAQQDSESLYQVNIDTRFRFVAKHSYSRFKNHSKTNLLFLKNKRIHLENWNRKLSNMNSIILLWCLCLLLTCTQEVRCMVSSHPCYRLGTLTIFKLKKKIYDNKEGDRQVDFLFAF